ncbi:uncharacterized protein CDAR_515451 [Caerostris darwini]|uniref:CUB domain-containing protein n=1 Tax=Caerostris darwini TaxID=1538125 RepID=A0AAV4P2A6_9ARAC|nr:uncharacterized protein CDAR_515451 [Caerostris darwini]
MDTHFGVLFLLFLTPWVAAYITHELERECLNGTVTFQLAPWGAESAAILKATPHTSYKLQMDCRARLVVPPQFAVMVSLRQVGFRINVQGSCKDYIQIQKETLCENIYRVDEERHFDSLSGPNIGQMDILYHTSKEGLDNKTLSGYPGFTLTFTAFTKNPSLNDSAFACSNGNRIWTGLQCDGHNNCGDLSDENTTECGSGGVSVLLILGILIVFVLVVMCVATLACSKNPTVSRIRSRTLSKIPRLGNRRST